MEYITQHRLKSHGIRRFSPLAALLRAERAYRERRHLQSLNDHQLDDIGLKRSDIS